MMELILEFQEFLGTLEGFGFKYECHIGCMKVYTCEFLNKLRYSYEYFSQIQA
jgi:hypothetical protein